MSCQRGDPLLGLAIRFLREFARLSQEGLARRAGISSSSLSGWETGRVMPEKASLVNFLASMGMPVEALRCTLLCVMDLRALERGETLARFGELPTLTLLRELGVEPPDPVWASAAADRHASPGRQPSGLFHPDLAAELDRTAFQVGKSAERAMRSYLRAQALLHGRGDLQPSPTHEAERDPEAGG